MAIPLIETVRSEPFTLTNVMKTLRSFEYFETSRREIDESSFRLRMESGEDLPRVSLLIESDVLTSLTFVLYEIVKPAQFSSPRHQEQVSLAKLVFEGSLQDLVDVFGKPRGARRKLGSPVHDQDIEEADEIAIWTFNRVTLTLARIQWDDVSPLAVTIDAARSDV